MPEYLEAYGYVSAPVVVRAITFNAFKNYLQPLPQVAIDQNPKIKQNRGY